MVHTIMYLKPTFVIGSLHEILDMVRILLSIWNRGRRRPENFTSTEIGTSAPLIPLLRRYAKNMNFYAMNDGLHFIFNIYTYYANNIKTFL